MDRHLKAFRDGATSLTKPLVLYGDDTIVEETVDLDASRVAIAEGTYTTLLEQVDLHIFIDRNFDQTRAHREKRRRDDSELDVFIDRVLTIEHEIISAQKSRAQIIIHADYTVSTASN
jgi:uridine kinase